MPRKPWTKRPGYGPPKKKKKRKSKRYKHNKPRPGDPAPVDELHVRFANLIGKLLDICYGRTNKYAVLTKIFYKAFFEKIKCPGRLTLSKMIEAQGLIHSIRHVDEEDLKQDLYIMLIEEHARYLKSKTYWYRTHFSHALYQHMAVQLAHRMGEAILIEQADARNPVFSEVTYMDDPEITKLNLGWVILSNKQQPFNKLTVFQKYLMFLKHSKGMTQPEVADLLGKDLPDVNREYVKINVTINNGESNEPTNKDPE